MIDTATIPPSREACPEIGEAEMKDCAELLAAIGRPSFGERFVDAMRSAGPSERCLAFEKKAGPHADCILDHGASAGHAMSIWHRLAQDALDQHLEECASKSLRVVIRPGVSVAEGIASIARCADSFIFTFSAERRIFAVFAVMEGGSFADEEKLRMARSADWLAACFVRDREKRVTDFRSGSDRVNRIVGSSPQFAALSGREKSVCVGILTGHTTEAISLHLNISKNSVLTFRRRLYQKLGVRSQNELFSSALIAAREMNG